MAACKAVTACWAWHSSNAAVCGWSYATGKLFVEKTGTAAN